jgi:hypothetical protein
MEDDATGDVATVLKAVRGLTAQEFDSALLPPLINATVAQMVEREPLHGEGPNMPAEKTKPMVRVHPVALFVMRM